jgi:hypothetical protein
VGLRRLENVRDRARTVIDEGVPGDFIETGVHRGDRRDRLDRRVLAPLGPTPAPVADLLHDLM